MPLCSRRAWTTCQGPLDPSRLTTYPPRWLRRRRRPSTFSIRYPDRKTAGDYHHDHPHTAARCCSTCTSFIPAKPQLASHFYPGIHTTPKTIAPTVSTHLSYVCSLSDLCSRLITHLKLARLI